jgi:fluoride exporter
MQAYVLVGIGGGLGAMARYGFGTLAGRLWGTAFPVGTLMINVLGSLAMGLLVGLLARTLPEGQNEIRLFVAVGVLGGFTTFSAFSLDAITLFERGDALAGVGYVLLSVVLSVLALYLGLLITRWGSL